MRNHLASLFALLLMVCAAQAQAYSSMFVFGDSLSDDGNNAVLLPSLLIPQTTAPFTQDFPAPVIAVGTYAGSNNYSNGPVWADYLAGALGLPLGPSLLGGNNYAFGGARTGLIGTADDNDIRPPNLQVQAASAVTDNGGVLPGDALYAVWAAPMISAPSAPNMAAACRPSTRWSCSNPTSDSPMASAPVSTISSRP